MDQSGVRTRLEDCFTEMSQVEPRERDPRGTIVGSNGIYSLRRQSAPGVPQSATVTSGRRPYVRGATGPNGTLQMAYKARPISKITEILRE
jgi:hypothetical protein